MDIMNFCKMFRYYLIPFLLAAYDDLINIKNGLDMGPNVAVVDQAMVYYRVCFLAPKLQYHMHVLISLLNCLICYVKIAVERNFTKGRRTDQVQAACLYIACR